MTTTPDAPGSWSAPSPSSAPPPWGQQSWGGQDPSDAQPWSQAPGGGGAPTWGPDPYAPGPGGPPGRIGPPVPPRPTNAWAVTALVTGILAIVPVAIVAGVVALNQTARTGEQGRGMAIAGLVLSGLWTMVSLVVAALLASALLALGEGWGWEEDDLTLEPPMATTEMIAGLDVGACLQMGRVATSVSCEVAHDAEIYLRSQLPDAETYPGEDELTWQADEICFQAFEGYVGRGYYASELEYGFYVPDATSWSEGDRGLACVVVPFAGDELVGPARDSRR